MNTIEMDASSIAKAVGDRKISALEVTRAAIARSKDEGAALNCFTEIFEQTALEEARQVDARIARGEDTGALAGVPVAVKNLFDVAGVVTLAGSRIDREKPPAVRDATALRRLRDAGAVLIGALGMDEYAYGFTNENTYYGPVRNPHDRDRTAGGSSGGSGAAVGSACVPMALGTDTNGSVRVPAALCGVFGLKPTYGRVSRAGVTPFTPSLDHVGVLARSARDLAVAFDLMHGHDAADPVSSARERERTMDGIGETKPRFAVSHASGYFHEEATGEALEAAERVAKSLGARGECSIPGAKAARHAAMIISAIEGSALHFADLQKRPADFDPMTRDRFIAGALMTGEPYVQAQLFRHAYRERLREIFRDTEILVAPATPMPAPKIGQTEIEIGGIVLPSRVHLGKFTQPISFVGLPVVVVPMQAGSGLPVGVQLIGAPFSEAKLLQAAHALEQQGVSRAVPAPRLS
jgi:AtzE family amidohydrolase